MNIAIEEHDIGWRDEHAPGEPTMTQHDRLTWSAHLFDASIPEAFGATRASQRLHWTLDEAQGEAQAWVGNDPIIWQPLEDLVSVGLTSNVDYHALVRGEYLPQQHIPESQFCWTTIFWYPPARDRWRDGTPLAATEADRLRIHGATWQIRGNEMEIISGRRSTYKVRASRRQHWTLEEAQAEAQTWMREMGISDQIQWGREEDHILVGRVIEGYNIVLRGRFLP